MSTANYSEVALFIQVVDSGSFTAAAERLGVSRAVISKHLSRLERQLGVQLLHRTTRRLSLTEAGQILYQGSRPNLAAIDEVQAEVSRLQSQPVGELRLNSPMSFGVLHVAPAIPAFLKQYPSVQVDIQLDDRKLDVIEGGFDVSIRIAELEDSSLVARRLGPCRHVLVAAPAYLQQRGRPEVPADLARHQIATYRYQQSSEDWHFIGPGQKQSAIKVNSHVRMNNSLALHEALLAGAGIARMPTFVVGQSIKTGRLQHVLPGYRSPELSIYAVYPQRRYLSPKVRAFIEFFAGVISESPDWDRFE